MYRWAAIVWLALAMPLSALEPREVIVLANKNEPRSREVAEHYMKVRGVPAENLITLDIITNEDLGRTDYEVRIVRPLRQHLSMRKTPVKALLSVYGMPLRVGTVPMTELEKTELVALQRELGAGRKELKELRELIQDLEATYKRIEIASIKENIDKRRGELPPVEAKVRELEAKDRKLQHFDSDAALDSELMLLWWDHYPKEQWIVNPLYFQFPESNRKRLPPVLMTSRLDGPTPEMAKRLVDDAVAVEKNGLNGIACVDSRGLAFDLKSDPVGSQAGGYDESMREMARMLESAKVTVQLENTLELFAPRSCRDVALYCGWYSLNNYIPCCEFTRGAVAWHLASQEAVSLRHPRTQWCSNLLMAGAAVTLGPVAEPYTVGFPKPAEFFGFLATGEYTLAEVYSRTTMLTSWRMVLVGDPLYNPYKNSPKLKSTDVHPSPQGSKFLLTP